MQGDDVSLSAPVPEKREHQAAPQKKSAPPPERKAPAADIFALTPGVSEGKVAASPHQTSPSGNAPMTLFMEDPSLAGHLAQGTEIPAPHGHPAKDKKPAGEARMQRLLTKVEKEKSEYGLSMQAPCPDDAVSHLRSQVENDLGTALPDDYARFLSRTNGLDHNGLTIFGSRTAPIAGYDDREIEGVVEANRDRRDVDSMKKYLVVGESGDMVYAFDPEKSRYVGLDSCSLDHCESYASFDTMLKAAFEANA
ncbi:MAG: YrhA family protein [Candidatus Eremiobacteraeota bacterium]|nr:YrhA family protein [Candidatus Eremiobacteraeota bacterium]